MLFYINNLNNSVYLPASTLRIITMFVFSQNFSIAVKEHSYKPLLKQITVVMMISLIINTLSAHPFRECESISLKKKHEQLYSVYLEMVVLGGLSPKELVW